MDTVNAVAERLRLTLSTPADERGAVDAVNAVAEGNTVEAATAVAERRSLTRGTSEAPWTR